MQQVLHVVNGRATWWRVLDELCHVLLVFGGGSSRGPPSDCLEGYCSESASPLAQSITQHTGMYNVCFVDDIIIVIGSRGWLQSASLLFILLSFVIAIAICEERMAIVFYFSCPSPPRFTLHTCIFFFLLVILVVVAPVFLLVYGACLGFADQTRLIPLLRGEKTTTP